MGRLIEQQAVIDCLTNTAKYYEREDADEWTKGIHYGLLHGVDNILDDVKPVEAIPKADYENRLKADVMSILKELQLKIEESEPLCNECDYAIDDCTSKAKVNNIIQQKIDLLQKQTTDNCDNCFNGTTKGGCVVKELMKNKDCKYYMPRKINALRGEINDSKNSIGNNPCGNC